jgi:hypothetical protein
MKKDYQDFLTVKEIAPTELSESIRLDITKEMNPTHLFVFSKLTLIQGFIGFITMIFCPQFDFSLTNSYDLFHYFHHTFGVQVCMIICGTIFLGSGAIFASYLLKDGEINKIKNSRFLYYTSLSIIALGTFLSLGAEIYLNLIVFWLIGAIIGGVSIFELNRVIKSRLLYGLDKS